MTKSEKPLSPSVTVNRATSLPEGGICDGVEIFAYSLELCVDLTVCETYHFQIKSFKSIGAKFV